MNWRDLKIKLSFKVKIKFGRNHVLECVGCGCSPTARRGVHWQSSGNPLAMPSRSEVGRSLPAALFLEKKKLVHPQKNFILIFIFKVFLKGKFAFWHHPPPRGVISLLLPYYKWWEIHRFDPNYPSNYNSKCTQLLWCVVVEGGSTSDICPG